jgi:hypothetical protein
MSVFITTCSRNKIEGGKAYSYFGWHNERRRSLINIRAHVLGLLIRGRIKSGVRLPVAGPDLGGRDEDGQYLPARKRYREGSFIGGLLASKKQLNDWLGKNRLYFLSALYGLVSCNEPIQNYDLRLDTSLRDLWLVEGKLASLLIQDLRDIRQEANIIDCTGDGDYSSLYDT